MHESLRFNVRCLDTAQHVSGSLMPIIRSLSTAVAASGLLLERGGSSVVSRGRSETCWAVSKRGAINVTDWCIWLVDLFENTKHSKYKYTYYQNTQMLQIK
jgi:hypothetical protein